MERNKWEEEFRQKFDQREIAPTPHAWERLDAMLNEADSKKPVRRINWLYVAAAVLGFAMLATLALRDWKTGRHAVVDQDSRPIEKHDAPQLPLVNDPAPEFGMAQKEHAPADENVAVAPHRQSVNPHKERVIAPATLQPDQPVAVGNKAEKTGNKPNLQSTPEIPATPDADVQLADAGKPVPQTIKVDARALLSQIDSELDQSFREKVLSGIGKKYQEVKVAVANRNRK